MPTIFDRERNDERTIKKAQDLVKNARATDVVLTDTVTGTQYRLVIVDAELKMEEL